MRTLTRTAGCALLICAMAITGTAVSGAAIPGAAMAHEFNVNGLHIVHPYTIEPVERLARRVPVYIKIRNTGAVTDRLLSVSSPHAAGAALVSARGAYTLRDINLPAGRELTLGPNTPHIELRDLTEPLEGYEYFPVTLMFEIAGRVDIEVCVEDRPEAQQVPTPQPPAH
jgi:periplasmic copper chaperone A